jgi:kinesin family protein 3/17
MDSKIYQCSLANLNDPTAPPKAFTFDGCYYTDSTTEALYNDIAYPLVEVKHNKYNFISIIDLSKYQNMGNLNL